MFNLVEKNDHGEWQLKFKFFRMVVRLVESYLQIKHHSVYSFILEVSVL